MCRLENAATRETARTIHEVMVDQFIASFEKPPTRLVLDVDATDDPVHGMQEHRGFHAYYDHYCFLPLYVFCGEKLLVSYLRPSRIDGAKHSWAILALLTKRLRQVWPKVKLIVRGDSGVEAKTEQRPQVEVVRCFDAISGLAQNALICPISL